jgi:hypothetical protein
MSRFELSCYFAPIFFSKKIKRRIYLYISHNMLNQLLLNLIYYAFLIVEKGDAAHGKLIRPP